ncbi:UPF0481 protein At3g47200-like [Carex rostrata]
MAQVDHVAIEIRTNDPLAVSIQNKLDKLVNTSKPYTIFRVPSYIRECNKNFYEPRIVSIGPYHRDREDLKCMEEQKLRYVKQLLSQNTDITLHKYLEVLRGLEPAARMCYYEKIDMDSGQFVEMLLFDACFIIQLAETYLYEEKPGTIFEIGWTVPLIKSDILMLENQIPFFVLKSVFDLYSSMDDDTYSSHTPSNFDSISQESVPPKASLSYLLGTFLQHETLPIPDADQNFDHLLAFYYHSYMCYMSSQKLPNKLKKVPLKLLRTRKVFPLISASIKRIIRRRLQMIAKRKPRMVPCATELKDAGITFKKAKSKSIFNIKFSNGVLTIPYTSIEEATRPQLMNLIAFEQCGGQETKPLTSYAVFMDCIVNTPRDVLILQQNGIIENKLADEKAAAEFFNQLRYCSYLDYEEHDLAMLFKKVKRYCDSSLHKYRAKLFRDYFSNPWSIISFIAAIMFLFLSTVQTLYSVLSYYHSSD